MVTKLFLSLSCDKRTEISEVEVKKFINSQNVRLFSRHFRLVQKSLLERRDGANPCWFAIFWKDNICERNRGEFVEKFAVFSFPISSLQNGLIFCTLYLYTVWSIQRRYDSYGWIQHEESFQGKCND